MYKRQTHHILVGGRNPQRVDRLVTALPSAAPFVVDLMDADGTEASGRSVEALDVLVHCAGITPGTAGSLRVRWREVMEVNVIAVAHLTEILLPLLRASGGLVLFINSGAGLRAMGDMGGYSASKFALTSFADGLRESERGRVRVSSLHPGRVDTEMQRQLQRRLGRDYHAEDHLTPRAVALAARAIVDAPPEAVWESVSIRPAGVG